MDNFKKSELNLLLPRVRKTIKKEEDLEKMQDEHLNLIGVQKKNFDILNAIKVLTEASDITDFFKIGLQNISQQIRIKQDSTMVKLQDLDKAINDLSKSVKFDKELYQSVLPILKGEFISTGDYVSEYCTEYLYLVLFNKNLSDENNSKYFFTKEAWEVFVQDLAKKFPREISKLF